ncbi:MAG: TonB-dependent receptor [Sphingobacteriales bacterium 41-5]|nr:MAG: TonB-dependent receptor [Sphingobacteriales bacterium 41-5]
MKKGWPISIAKLILSLCLMMQGMFASSQVERPKLSAQFDSLPIENALLTIENQTNYRFYYDKTAFDTTKVSLNANNISISDALESILVNTGLNYSIDVSEKNVFITKGLLVQTTLPSNFYKSDTVQNQSSAVESAMLFKPGSDDKEVILLGRGDESGVNRVTISGTVRDEKTGEPIISASVYIQNPNIGVITDQFGTFTIMLPKGRHTLNVQSIGMEDIERQILVKGESSLNIVMQSRILTLRNVIISTQKTNNIRNTQLGVQKLDIKTIKQVPVVFGEADLLRVVATMPGVKTVGEAATGLNIRGGSVDQNLMLFNDANVYNPAHFFGMFSAFNPEVVKEVEVFKSSVPAKYGGRLSSVVNITGREGNKKNFAGSAGIGLLTSRLTLEGPIIKDKSSFIVAGRSTYANWLLNLLPDQYKNSKADFYDANLLLNHEFNKNNTVYLTGYLSNDRFNLNSDTFFHYKNFNYNLKWKHTFNNRLYSLINIGQDKYEYKITSERNPVNAYALSFNVRQSYFNAHFNYFINSKHTLEFGLNTLLYKLLPGDYVPVGSESLAAPLHMPFEQALESALYISDRFNITKDLTLDAGIRYSMFNYLGPYEVNNYPQGVPKRVENMTGTTIYAKNKIIHTYHGPEIRIGIRQMLSNTMSLKAGYNSLRQYIHMLSNTAAMAPTDIWKLSDPNISPQFGDQFSLGLYKNLKSNTIELSVEGYYKRIKDYLDFKSGAILVLNSHIETEVAKTQGTAYGIEFLAKKLTGKLNGWVGYTYSRILLKADQAETGEFLNNGKIYPANYDKPHDLTLVSNYRFSHRFSTSFNATYSTGRPITLPIGKFRYAEGERTLYGPRNGHRIPDYFRMDFSMNIEGNHKVHQRTHNSWTIGIYNLTGRKNPYSVYYVSENGVINGYKLSIFGSAIPFVNFNIRF